MIKYGSFRMVWLIGSLAIKMPRPTRDSFKGLLHSVLQGWLQNLSERAYSKTNDSHLCPIWFSCFGLFIIMPRCAEISEKESKAFFESKWDCPFWYVIEEKRSSLGKYKGRIVAVDYGNDSVALRENKLRLRNGVAPISAKGMCLVEEE